MFDVAIIGGGIIGLMSALEFSKAGLSVAIIDKDEIGRAASLAGGGILSSLCPWRDPKPYQALCDLSQKKYTQLANELLQKTGIDPEFIQSGLLILDPEYSSELDDWRASSTSKVELIDRKDISDFAKIANCQQDALWLPEVAQIRNPKLIQALTKLLLGSGVKIIEKNTIKNINYRKNNQVDEIDSLVCQQGEIKAEHYILSAGAWSGAELFKANIDIKPIRGQMLCYQPGVKIVDKIILSAGRYIIPRKDNVLLIGSTIEDAGFDLSTTDDARKELHLFATELIPELTGLEPIKHWAGLRPKTSHGLPYIGRHSNIKNMFINTGHYRNGLLTAPVSAELLADIMLQRTPIMPVDAFDPATH